MSGAIPTVGVFYSRGPHLIRTLQKMRERFPQARIVAYLPKGFPVSAEIGAAADEIVHTELTNYSPADLAACTRLVREFRSRRFAAFVIMFDSVQLKTLSALSGARTRLCCMPQGRVVELRAPIPIIFLEEILRRTVGAAVYFVVAAAVRLTKVGEPRI